jgi:hypothetical protein
VEGERDGEDVREFERAIVDFDGEKTSHESAGRYARLG